MDEWTPRDRTNPNFRRVERKRALWRKDKRDRSTFLSLRAESGIANELAQRDTLELDDLEDFMFDLQDRFRSSTTQNLVSIHDFYPKKNEELEHIFACFNLIARPLENGYPLSLTENQITTNYVHHLESTLKPDDVRDLERQIQDSEHRRTTKGRRPLNRHHIHDMALRWDREIVMRQTRLRAA